MVGVFWRYRPVPVPGIYPITVSDGDSAMRRPSMAAGLAAFTGCGATAFGSVTVIRSGHHANGVAGLLSAVLVLACLAVIAAISIAEIVNRPEVIQSKGVRATSRRWFHRAATPAERERVMRMQLVHVMILQGIKPRDETLRELLGSDPHLPAQESELESEP
ncbi:hypothetical protein AGRA3207_004814 [Actinomadura graeca]|uniref:Uncharacterized protein n=1 Tax=Actinomadura graeca TaxID=2750812 RepID=A0ABX8R0Y8_9ACTN|nr:hypothetical protein [Actinomadura graeca]QXJ23632.1 hypothetical protein AGRA3207_004814 [Actinomadura graeca]